MSSLNLQPMVPRTGRIHAALRGSPRLTASPNHTGPKSSSSSCVRRRRAGTKYLSGRHFPTVGSADLGPPTQVWPSPGLSCLLRPASRTKVAPEPCNATANARTRGRTQQPRPDRMDVLLATTATQLGRANSEDRGSERYGGRVGRCYP